MQANKFTVTSSPNMKKKPNLFSKIKNLMTISKKSKNLSRSKSLSVIREREMIIQKLRFNEKQYEERILTLTAKVKKLSEEKVKLNSFLYDGSAPKMKKKSQRRSNGYIHKSKNEIKNQQENSFVILL